MARMHTKDSNGDMYVIVDRAKGPVMPDPEPGETVDGMLAREVAQADTIRVATDTEHKRKVVTLVRP